MTKRKTFTISLSRTIDLSHLKGPDQFIKVGTSSTYELADGDDAKKEYKKADSEVREDLTYSIKNIYNKINKN